MVGLWSYNIDMPEKASNIASHGFLVCYSITILYIIKVLLYVMFKGFKVVVWCRVVACKDNSKVNRCGVSVCCCRVVVMLWIVWCLVGWVVDRVRGWGKERTLSRALPNEKRRYCDSILTDLHTLTIHLTVYLILVFQII